MKTLFLTGAGISANAGIPTYRSTGSSWTNADLEKKSHAASYGNHLDELWDKHWGPLSLQMKIAEPTHAHKVMAEFAKNNPETIVATQNIDLLHEQAGSDNVAHVHGSMEAICIRCHSIDIAAWGGTGAPECNKCGKRKTRPNVVLFGEQLNRKQMRGLETWRDQSDLVVAVGTSLNVFPAAGLVFDAITAGKRTVIINMEKTPFDKFASVVYHEDADKVLEDALQQELDSEELTRP